MGTDRRTFIKKTCLFCASAVFSPLISCSPSLPTYHVKFSGNTLTVPVSGFNESNILFVRDDQAAYDILVVRVHVSQYDALFMRCSHGDYALGTSPDGLTCPAHGGMFNYDGTVLKGPATEPLLRFPIEFNSDQGILTINIEALNI